jgi:hypothetical protein
MEQKQLTEKQQKAKAYYLAHSEERKAYQKDYNRRLKKGNEWMKNLPSLAEIRWEWKRCEAEIQYVTVPTMDL